MIAKEKAEQLTNKFLLLTPITCGIGCAKQCALIAVDEILQNVYDDRATIGRLNLTDKEFWTEVKQEIQKL
jgi:hypothetical protein